MRGRELGIFVEHAQLERNRSSDRLLRRRKGNTYTRARARYCMCFSSSSVIAIISRFPSIVALRFHVAEKGIRCSFEKIESRKERSETGGEKIFFLSFFLSFFLFGEGRGIVAIAAPCVRTLGLL